MYQQIVRNEDGEPLYIENVRDPYEEEIAWCEEMDERAADPMYAARIEDERWYNIACSVFEERGIRVPNDVICALKRELRNKEELQKEEGALAEVQPVVDFLNKHFPNTFYAIYNPPTPIEVGYAEIDIACGKRPYRDEVEALIPIAEAQGIYITDYLSLRDLKKKR